MTNPRKELSVRKIKLTEKEKKEFVGVGNLIKDQKAILVGLKFYCQNIVVGVFDRKKIKNRENARINYDNAEKGWIEVGHYKETK